MRALAILLVACSAPSASVRREVTREPATPCPPQRDLDRLGVAAWGIAIDNVQCTPMRRGNQTYWWLSAGGSGQLQSRAIVEPAARVAWRDKPAAGDAPLYGRAVAHDLDGDGNDEILFEETTTEGKESSSLLVVLAVSATDHAPVRGVAVLGTSTNAGATECHGEWRLVPDGVRQNIAIEQAGTCTASRAVYRWNGSKLEKLN
jgi:hypothetical protein